MNQRKKRMLIGLLSLLLLMAVVIGGNYLARVDRYQKQIQGIRYTEQPLSQLPDGVYEGSYDADMVGAKVAVTLEDGVITNIRLLEHKNDRGSAAERILQSIQQEQRIDVDAVSGATNSSKVIKKAVEQALINAKS